ncbi:MAG: 1-(5-phosphoribosyl)-5-[(5-phosphoribosylamino)methylideneamino]imidazole-4-carboxamide isomerase [Acidobacteria bacterium]|nr:1-(5-phosphoribosyl)-5-[(5-phosphoribosylamino)methylideneamino]imidazole-4-carboxamide isomerase [Acidobacteriota bacterium]
MLILPAIDLKNGCCVRLSQGEKEKVKVYDQDPLSVAASFLDSGAEMIHIVDLDGAFSGTITKNLEIVRRIVLELKALVEFGGGVRDEKTLELLLEIGVSRVILGTIAIENPKVLNLLAKKYAKHLAIGIDARDGMVATQGWEKTTEVEAISLAKQVKEIGIERVIYTDIAQDGMLQGPNLKMTQKLAQTSKLKITASGGIGKLDDISDLKALEKDGVDSCIIGKAIYEKRFTLTEAINVAK